MTDTSAKNVGDTVIEAAALIRFGLSPKLRPSRDAEYTALVVRYNADPEFRAFVRAVAVGQGLLVLACDRMEGIVLVPSEDSPYRVRLSDYVLVQSSDTRLLHGVVQLAVAATAYPTAAALEDSSRLVSVTASQVYERIRAVVDDEHVAGAPAASESDPAVEPVWRVIRRLRAADTTPDGRDTPHNVIGAVRKALRWLEEKGLADEVRGEADMWRLRDRYRLQVLAAANAALDVMRADGKES